MNLDLDFNEHESKEKRDKRIVKIMEEYSKLSPEMQEAVLNFAESLIEEKRSDGQDPVI